MSGVICDRRAAGIKGKFYKMVVRPARIYGLKMLELKVLELEDFLWKGLGWISEGQSFGEHV